MQPICSFHSIPGSRVWFLGAFHAVGMALAMLAAVGLRIGWRDGLVVFAILAFLVVLAPRLIHRLLKSLGFMTNRCLVIGTNGEARRAIDLIHRHPHSGLQVVGMVSLIGPRPEREFFVRQLAEQIPFYAERFMVRPGITGWAQVVQSYAASVEESRRKLQADLYYIKHMSFLTDMYIILKTLKIVLCGREWNRSVGDVSAMGASVVEPLPGPAAPTASAVSA